MNRRALSAALALALFGAVQARAAQAPFAIGAPLAGRAIFGCSAVAVQDGSTVRSGGVASYAAKEGLAHVASNGDILVTSRSTVLGDAAAGPGHLANVASDAYVSGLTTPAAAAVDCVPVDLAKLSATLASNDNAKIPKTALGRSALRGPGSDALVLDGHDSLALPAGTFVLSSIDLSERAHVTVSGEAHVLVTGSVRVAGNSFLNPAGGAFRLRLFVAGPRVSVEGLSTLGAIVFAPSADAFIGSESRVLGSVFAKTVTLREASAVIRLVDDTPPVLTLVEPADAGQSSLAAIRVRGFARDPETAVTAARVNGSPVSLQDDGSFDATMDFTGASEVRVDAENAMGLVATVRVNLCSGPPAVALVSPASGSLVDARIGTVTGTVRGAISVAVNGHAAVLGDGTFRLDGFDFGPDGVVALQAIAVNACAQASASSVFTLDTAPPVVAIDTPTPGSVLASSPVSVSGTFVEPNLAGITVNGVPATISGNRFTAGAVPIPPGPSTLVAEAKDRLGRVGVSAPVAITLDTQNSSVVITSPASGALTGDGTATVSGTANVPGLASVRVLGRAATLSGTSFTVSGVPLAEGDNRLVAEAIDSANRSFFSQAVVVTLDSLPPDVALDASSFPSLTRLTTVNVSGTAADPHLAAVTVNGVAAVVSAGRFTAANVPLAEGPNAVRAHAVDALGHAADSAPAAVERDTQAPAVAIVSPAPNAQLGAAAVTVTGTAADAHLAGVTVNGIPAAVANGQFTAQLTLAEGDTTLVARAVDSLGNAGASAGVPVTVDTLAPVVSIDPPADPLTGSPFVTVTGSIEEPHLLSLTVAGVPASVSSGRFVAANVPLVEGNQRITAIALDTFGHRAESSPVEYRLDSTPPALTLDAPAADSAACRAPGPPVAVSGRVYGRAGVRPVVTLDLERAGGTSQSFTATLDAAGTSWTVPAVDLGSADGTATLTASTTDALGHVVRVLRTFRIKASAPSLRILLDGSAMPGSAAGAAAGPGETPVLFGRALAPRASVADASGATPPPAVATLDGAPWTGAPISQEGTHLLSVTATDCAGHAASAHALFTIDVTPPRLLSLVPADGVTLGAAVTAVSGTSDPDLASATVNGTAASVNGGAFSASPFSSKEGTNAASIVLVDKAGNRAVFSRSFNVRSIGPSVEILESGAPLGSGARFFRPVAPIVRSNDASATVLATLNGGSFLSGTSISASGDYTLSATASDALGHSSSANASFKVDLTPGPAVDIVTPADRAVLAGPTVAVTGTASASVTSVAVNGRAATLAGATWSLPDLVLPFDLPVEIVAIGADAGGRTASATRQVTVRSSGPQIAILEPADGARTNRKKIDVAGAVVGGPAATSDGKVTVAGQTLLLDALGTFRAKDVALLSGANTLTATATDALGRVGTASVTVTTDTAAPGIALAADGQPLAEGASFARPFTLRVTITDDSIPAPVPTIRLNGQDKGATAAVTDLPIAQAGGYALSVVARDAAGNESRADRSFVLASGGCAVSAVDPGDGAVVAAPKVTLKGRSGDAASVAITSGGQTFAAQLADGTFAAGDVPLAAVGGNALSIACTDRAGAVSTTSLTITRLADGAGPLVHIVQPAGGARQAGATAAVTGTVSDPAAAVTVNGLKATVSAGGFSAGPLPLVEGPNVLAARAVDAAGRSGEDRVVVFRDSAAPKVVITSPPDGAHVGKPGSGPALLNVSGLVDLTSEPNLSSVVVATGAGSVTATVDPDTGGFFASGVPLSTASPGVPQGVTATATDTLAQSATARVNVIYDPAFPALVLSLPVDGARFNETAPPSFTASGEAWAKDGAVVSVNGGGLDGLAWDAPDAAGRRHASFTAQVTVPAAEGPFGVIVRVEEPSGAYANDKRLLFKDVTAPAVVDMQPGDGAKQVDANEIPLVLFSEAIRPSSLAAADGLTLTRVSTGEKAVGTFTVAGSAVAFAPGAAMVRGEAYRFRAGTGITDLAAHALAAAKEVTFTIAAVGTAAAPVLDALPAVVCAAQLVVAGSAAPNAFVRVRDGNLSFTGNADAAGRFAVTLPLSGNGWHAVHAAVLDGAGAAGPEAAALFRVDCSAPAVVGATFDRGTGKIALVFAEAMNASTLTVGGAGSAITVSKADDATNAPQAAALSLSTDGLTATLDLGSGASAWWANLPVRLLVGPPAADAAGNAMSAPFSTVFFAGGGGDLSGGFLSGAALDDESGRPLAGADAKLYASGAALPGAVLAGQVTPPTASTVTDGRGRFSLAGDIAAGRYALVLSRSGYTRAVRRLALEPSVGAVPFGSRLTPLAAQAPSLLAPGSGGSFAGPAGSNAAVDFAANALASATSLGVVLTPLSGQGLPEPLPLGWTPLAAAELRLIPNGAGEDALPEGAGTPFAPGSVTLTLPLPAGINPSDLYAARYDVVAGAWLALPLPIFIAGGGSTADRARVALAGPGSVAIIAPDADPATRPAVLPVSLDAPLVGVDPPAPPPTLTATISLEPAVVSPTGRATARVVARSSDGTTPWPSGLAVQGYLDEKLVLSGGSGELYEAPFTADLVLYRPPLSAGDLGGTAPGAAGALTFRVSPSPRAAQVLLDTGYENVRLFPYTDQLERGQVLGPAGGSITTADGIELVVPESGLAQKTIVTAHKLSAAELAALTPVAGYATVAGVRVGFSGVTLARAATLKLNAPAGLPSDAADDPRFVLAVAVDQPDDGRGAFANAVSRVTLLPAAGAVPAKLVAAPETPGSPLPFPGLATEGLFLFLHANAPIGFVSGRVTAPNGAGIAGSRVTAAPLGTANLSVPGGVYAVPAPAGAPTLSALHPVLGIAGSGQVPVLAKGQVATLDLVLTPVPPQIRALQPANGAVDQPVGSAVAVAFSAALDPASVTSATVAVSLADAAGAPTGLLFNGSVSLSPDRTTVVFTPARPLPPGRKIAARFTGGVRDAAGTLYGGALPVDWSFTTSTQFVTGGAIHPEKIRMLVPANGVAQILGADGALPLVTGGTTPWSVWADVEGPVCPSKVTQPANGNGGFALAAGCPPVAPVALASRVWLHVIDPTGAEAATFRLGPFTTPDGKGFVASPGDTFVFTSAEGVEVTAPAGAFDVPTLVTVAKQPLDSLNVPLNSGLEMGAVVSLDFDGTAKETLRLRVPVVTGAPVGGLVFAGTPIELPWGRKLKILDVGRLVDDGTGGKLMSTLEADQPDDPAEGSSLVGPASARAAGSGRQAQALPKKLLRSILLEMTARSTVGLVYGATLPLFGITGATASATLFVLYNAYADALIFEAVASNWNGRYLVPVFGDRPFTVVKRDTATGWVLARKDYPTPSGTTGLTSVGTLDPGPDTPPMLVDASPLRVSRWTAPPVDDLRAEDVLRLALEVEAHVTSLRKALLRSTAEFPLPNGTSVDLFNFTQATAASPSGALSSRAFVDAGTFVTSEIAAQPGDDMFTLVSSADLDPAGISDLTFTFSRSLEAPADPATLLELTDCGPAADAAGSAPPCSGTNLVLTADLTRGNTTLVAHLPGRLAQGRQYRLTLKRALIKAATNPVPYPLEAPAVFYFATHRTGEPIGKDVTSALGDTNSARDLLKFGNLLLVGSATGRLVAVDMSDPKNPRTWATLVNVDRGSGAPVASDAKADSLRAFATDGHGRLFYNVQFGATWGVKAVAIEDVRKRAAPCPAAPFFPGVPCFEAAEGGTRTAFAAGAVGALLGSEYLQLVGALATGTPTGLELMVRDDFEPPEIAPPYEFTELYDKQNGAGAFARAPLPPDRFWEFDLDVDTTTHQPPATRLSVCGEPSRDHFQRVSVDNLSTGNTWSVDVENPWLPGPGGSGKAKIHLRGRPGDQVRVRYNVLTLGYLAVQGSGITVLDLNRMYRNPSPTSGAAAQQNKSDCNRRIGRYEGEELRLYTACPPPASQADADKATMWNGLENTPALAVVPGFTDVHVFSVLTHFGFVHEAAPFASPQALAVGKSPLSPDWAQPDDAPCLKGRAPAGLPPSYRAVAYAKSAAWTDRGLFAPDDGPSFVPTAGFAPKSVTGDLLFVSLGSAGVLSYELADFSKHQRLVGRYWADGHSVYRLQADVPHGLLFAGGQDRDGNSIVDVWDLARANGGPSADGTFPPASGAPVDGRLLATLYVPWDTNHIGLDETGIGIVTTWGYRKSPGGGGSPPATEEGGFAMPFDAPTFSFAGVYRASNDDPPAGSPIRTVTHPASRFEPLGVPLRLSAQSERDNARDDERCLDADLSDPVRCHTAAFKVRVAIPGAAAGGTAGATLSARVQSLRALPDKRLLATDDLGPLVAPCGGIAPCDGMAHAKESGWPDRDVYVTLRRVGKGGSTDSSSNDGPTTNAYNLYESDETVLLVADPRARFEYWKPIQALGLAGAKKFEERAQCRRCDRPPWLSQDETDPLVVELLAGGPYVRAVLAVNPNEGNTVTAGDTRAALAYFNRPNFLPPSGFANLAGFADEVPSPMQVSLAEPARNPAAVAIEAGASVRLASGEAVVEARDFAAGARALGFAFDRTYRSGALGHGPLGAAGWNASLFAHLREIPLPAEAGKGASYVDYHDGAGQVWRFVGLAKDAIDPSCPPGSRDVGEAYCAPPGLPLRLDKNFDGTFRLVGRNNDTTYFDAAGRLTRLSDRYTPTDPSTGGSSVRLYYTGAGELARVEDEMGRVYRLTYFADKASPDTYGLLRTVEDFSSPSRRLKFDYAQRRLRSVTLPDVLTTSTLGAPHLDVAITYDYETRVLEPTAPAHGAVFSKLKLLSFTPPGKTYARIAFNWDTASGRATAVRAPEGAAWNLLPSANTVDPPATVLLTAPTGLATTFVLDANARVVERRSTFEVSGAVGDPAPAPPADRLVTERATYLDDGRVATVTRGDGNVTTFDYGSGKTRLRSPNADSVNDAGRITSLEYTDDNLLRKYTDPLARAVELPVLPAMATRSLPADFSSPSGFRAENVLATTLANPFAQAKTFYDGGDASPNVTTAFFYENDKLGRKDAGFLKRVDRGALSEEYERDDRGNVKSVTASSGVKHAAEYDEWDRPFREVLGQGGGSYAGVDEHIEREWDVIGRLVTEQRSQKRADGSPATVTTRFAYNDRDQITSVTQDSVGASEPGGGASATAVTSITYDARGLPKLVTSPGGIQTSYTFDKLGRVMNVTPPASDTRVFGYDEVGRLTFAKGGAAGEWKGRYDAWGGLVHEDHATGAAVDRTFDSAGGLLDATLSDAFSGNQLARVDGVHVTSFGEVSTMTRQQGLGPATQALGLTQSFDTSGRLQERRSGARLDAGLGYDASGRVASVADSLRRLSFAYGQPAPWADRLSFGEAQTGGAGFVPTLESSVGRDAYGRVTSDDRTDGTSRTFGYDEAGRPLTTTDGASTSKFTWDARGSLLVSERPGPQGPTQYGYDLDGRLRKKRTVLPAAGVFETTYDFDAAGRLSDVKRPDGLFEHYVYGLDDTLSVVTRSDGATLTYSYDDAKRVKSRVAAGGSAVSGGETFDWDAASRLKGATRLQPNGKDPIAPAAVVPGQYDLAGRAHAETVGARPALTRDYDDLGGVTSLGLPVGVGAAQAFSYARAFEPGSHRLASITGGSPLAPPPGALAAASLGASWAWQGEDRVLGVTTNGPLHAAHRFGYTGAAGVPGGAVKLSSLTVGTDPNAKNLLPFGDVGAPGSSAWGQFQYGYDGTTRDGTKLGRAIATLGLTAGSVLSGQGFAYGLDNAKRLSVAYAGPGSVKGADAAAALAAFERFKYDYGTADQLKTETREIEGRSVGYETGGDGRPDTRQIDPDLATPGPKIPFAYDGAKRRTADDRFTYAWHYDGKIAEAIVKDCWPIEHGESQGPTCPAGYTQSAAAGNKLVFSYDALSRLLTRTRLGQIPSGGTDADRPFIEAREYLFDGNTLLAEAAKAQDGTIRWRKTYVPGASLHDHVQVRVEIYDVASNLASDRLYAYLRDEQGTVLALADESSSPASPVLPLRYLYSPYGNAHAEIGPELRRGSYVFALTSVKDAGGTPRAQSATGALPGGVRLSFGIDVDPAAFGGILFERRETDGTWSALTAADLAIGRAPDATNSQVDVLPLAGFAFATSYRVRTTAGLKDVMGRPLADPKVLELPQTPPLIPPADIGASSFEYDRPFPVEYDSAQAAGNDARGLFPGGQPMGFQGQYTDPILGLLLTPNRVYDARNASWLSQDPLEDRDSPNLYGFVGARPHELTDPLGLTSFGEWVNEFADEAFAGDSAIKKTAAGALFFVDAAFSVASAGATKKIDQAQEDLDSGKISQGQYWKRTGAAVGQAAASYAAGGAAGAGGARLASAALGARTATAIGARLTGAVAGAFGGTAAVAASDAVGIAAGVQDNPSSLSTYASAAVVGAAIGSATAAPYQKVTQLRANQEIGDEARDGIAAQFPGSQTERTLQAASGPRRLDVLTPSGTGIESKVGRTGLSARVRQELQRDVELLNDPLSPVKSMEWHFTRSEITGKVGPTKPLEKALNAAGIKIVIGP